MEPLLAHLAAENILDVILRFLSTDSAATSVCVSCAECLFVMAVKLPPIVQQIVDLQAISYLTDVITDSRYAHLLRNYIAAVVRLISEKHCDQFLDVVFFEKSAGMLCREEESKYVVTLLLELVTLVLNHYPQFYAQRIRENALTLQNFSQACGMLCGSLEPEIVAASCALFQCLFALESSAEGALIHDFYTISLSNDSWKSLVVKEGASRAVQIATFRIMVQFAFTTSSIELLLERVVRCGVILCTMMTLPQVPGDDDQVKIIKLEASIAILLLMAKHPLARAAVLETLQPHSGWRDALRTSVHHLLSSVQMDFFNHIPIVDVNGTYLNNVSYALQLINDWDNWTEVMGVCVAMFRDQDMVYAQQRGHAPQAPSAQWNATMGQLNVDAADPRASRMVSTTQRVQRLTYALLNTMLDTLAPVQPLVRPTTPPAPVQQPTAQSAPPPASISAVRPTQTPPIPLLPQSPYHTAQQPLTPRRQNSKAAPSRLTTSAPPSYPEGMAAKVRYQEGPPKGTLAASKYVLKPTTLHVPGLANHHNKEKGHTSQQRGRTPPPRRAVPFYTQRLHSPPPTTRDEEQLDQMAVIPMDAMAAADPAHVPPLFRPRKWR
jgi:hypothetical protein